MKKYLLLVSTALAIVLAGCSKSSSTSSSSEPSNDSVTGFYQSKQGMAGSGGTIKIMDGNTFVMKDAALENGTMRGEWSLTRRTITFYHDGSTLFEGVVGRDYIDIGPGKCDYYKK